MGSLKGKLLIDEKFDMGSDFIRVVLVELKFRVFRIFCGDKAKIWGKGDSLCK